MRDRSAILGNPGWALVLLALAGVLGVLRHQPPAPLPVDAPLERFSAGRALADVAAIARAPHPVGTAEHARVRDYLVERLRALGLEPEVQRTLAVSRKYPAATRVANIVARKKGIGDGKAVMLVAHYDSVPTGPGASDDAAGVAAILETVRWLGTQPPLANDLIVLITDGEEVGLAGAEGFVASHPWAKDVGFLVNLEARGHAGPAILFETSDGNADLIATIGARVGAAVANSLTYEVYRLLPNDTDFTVFKRAGMRGVNIAFLDGVTHYHSALDTPDNADPASVQHHGEYLTSLAAAFGNRELPPGSRSDAVYFNAPWGGLVLYPAAAALPLAGLGALLTLVLLIHAWRTSGVVRVGIALLRAFLLPATAALFAWLVWAGLRRANPNFHWLSNGNGYHTDFLLYGVAVLLVLGVAAMSGHKDADRAAIWSWWAALAVTSAIFLPGASWLFGWPLLAGVAGEWAARRDGDRATLWRTLGLAPLAYLFVPLVHLLFIALGPSMLAAVAAVAALALLPVGPLLAAWRRPAAYAALAVVGLSLIGTALVRSGFGPDQRKPNHVVYLLDRTGSDGSPARARWMSADEDVDRWSGQFLGAHPAQVAMPQFARRETWWEGEAPRLDLPVPQARIIGDEVRDGVRHLTLLMTTRADVLTLISDGETSVRALDVGGQRLFDRGAGAPFRRAQLIAPAPEGTELRFQLSPGRPLDLQVLQQFWGLPSAEAFRQTPRDADMMTTPHRQADSRYTLDRWTF